MSLHTVVAYRGADVVAACQTEDARQAYRVFSGLSRSIRNGRTSGPIIGGLPIGATNATIAEWFSDSRDYELTGKLIARTAR